MATKAFYHDIDLQGVGEVTNARVQNLSASQIDTLAATLGVANRGLIVYNTTAKSLMTWNGVSFDSYSYEVVGDIRFAGLLNPALSSTIVPVAGAQYVVDTAGTLSTQAGAITYTPSANVEVGDVVLFTTPTTAFITQRNLEQATDSTLGTVRLATQAEVDAGTDGVEAVTPATLHGYVDPALANLQGQITSNDGDITALQGRATALETDVASLQTFTGEGTSLTTVASTLAGAVNELDADVATNATAIAAETTRATGAETVLQNNIDTEAAARLSGDASLQSNIDAEAATRAANDTTLQNNINTEAAARAAADTTLQANIDAEETRALAAEGALDTRLTQAEADIDALEARDEVFTYFGSHNLSANTPLTISHGLGLADKDAFTINIMHGGAQVSLAVVSVSVNALTIESAVALSDVKVSIIGF